MNIRKKAWWFQLFIHGLNIVLSNVVYLYENSGAVKIEQKDVHRVLTRNCSQLRRKISVTIDNNPLLWYKWNET